MKEEEPLLEVPGSKPKKKVEHISEPVTISLRGLRDGLFDELNLLRSGKISVSRARVTSQLARRIIETVTLDLVAQNILGDGTSKEIKRLMTQNVQG
jgi:hypothetical protein